MRNVILILIVCLLAATACSRKKSANQADKEGGATGQTLEQKREQANTLLQRGKEFYRKDEDEQAIEAFKEAVKLDPDLAEAHFRLGLSYDALGQDQNAEDAYKKAVESYKKFFAVEENSKDAEAHYNLGQTYAGLHNYSEAIREYRKATRLKSDDASIYYDLGVAHMKLAQYDEAVSAFSKSLELDPENFRAEDELAEARDGVNRIKAGRKHQEDLFKKKKEEEQKKGEGSGGTPEVREASAKKPV